MRKLLWFAGAFAVAALFCVYLLPVLPIWVGMVPLLCGIALLIFKKRILRYGIAILLGIGMGLIWTSGYYALMIQPAAELSGTTQTVSGTVCNYAQPTPYGYKVELELDHADRGYRTLLYLAGEAQTLKPGDRLTTSAKLELASYRYSQEQNVYQRSQGYVLLAYGQGEWSSEAVQKIPLRFIPAWTAHQLQEQIDKLFPADAAAFLRALLTGDRSGFDYQTKNALSLAGVSHVVAISGMHVSILLALVLFVLPDRRFAAAVGIPIVVFYAILTGASPSVVRAATMQILLLIAPLLRRENDPPTSLSAAMLLILLINPWAIADVSFQLSFAAMAGLLLFSRRIYDYLDARLAERKLPRVLEKMGKAAILSVSTTLGAMVFTTPLIACSFGVISLVSVAANFLTLWAVSICFQAGMVACVLGFVLPGMAGILTWCLSWLVRYFLVVTNWLAALPFAAIYTDSGYTVLVLVAAYLLLAVYFLFRTGRKPLMMLVCMVVCLCLCTGLNVWENRRAELQTTVLDVGQGQCILLEWDGMTAMIDCGGSYPEEAGEAAARLLLSHGRTTLDLLILTHFDTDHAGGIPQLLNRIDVDCLYVPPAEPEDGLYLQICEAAAQSGTQIKAVTEDLVLSRSETEVRIFAPVSYHPGNDGGLSVLSSREDYDILVTGDMSFEAEHRLVTLQDLPQVELLVAGHHGSATSTGMELLEAVQPRTVLISVGSENRYGHPTQETLDRIEAVGAQVYRTDLHTTITIRR